MQPACQRANTIETISYDLAVAPSALLWCILRRSARFWCVRPHWAGAASSQFCKPPDSRRACKVTGRWHSLTTADPGCPMKITVDISDALHERAREVARERGQTLQSVVESALRSYVDAQRAPTPAFRLRDASVDGSGLRPAAARLFRRHQLAVSLAEAAEILGDAEKAASWFRAPCPALGGKAPRELMRTDPGVDIVREELQRIRYGYWA